MHPSVQTIINQSAEIQSKTLAVLQPGYLPWLGFFDQMLRSDVFVVYDDVQYDKNGWRNRNRVKSPTGPHWLTVPVKVNLGQKILDVEIDNKTDWKRKQVGTVKQFYSKARYHNEVFRDFENILANDWKMLIDLDMAFIDMARKWLCIDSELARSSRLNTGGDRNTRLVNFCLKCSATNYLSGNAAQDYLDVQMFQDAKISVEWQDYKHPTYPQGSGEFLSYLSVLDLLMHCGSDSRAVISSCSKIC